ncbi:MAG: class I tRNA ligase family protein, partial [Haloarculaceae archaeon]
DHTIDWLNEWPCIRNYGLGTKLPWDDDFVIEPLSDSTIYMAYYTIAHRLQDVPPEAMDREFFDTLFYGASEAQSASNASEAQSVSDASGDDETPRAVDDPDERALELREEWDYWYPVDVRCSANDLIQNHLTFFLFHHAELFPEPKWPEGITIMGMGLLEGEKMSSSKGHVVLPGEAIEEYGADTVRFFLLNSAEPWQDYDWRAEEVGNTRDQLSRFWNRAQDVIDADVPDDPDRQPIDRWLLSKLQETIRETTAALDGFETRTASQTAFYAFEEHLKWYRRRADLDRPGAAWTLREVLDTRLRLLAPFVPFMTNELYEQLTGRPAEDAAWPEPDPDLESDAAELREQLIERLTDDVHDIVDVTDTDPDVVRVYAAADWKYDVFETVRERATRTTADGDESGDRETSIDVGAVMSEVMQDPDLRERGNAVNDLVQDLVELVRERDDETLAAMADVDERAVYESAAAFLEREFDADVEVYAEDGEDVVDPASKAGQAVPFRPAVHLE